MFRGVQADVEANSMQLFQQLLKLAVGLDGGMKTWEGAITDLVVGDMVGVVVEDAFGHRDAKIYEASRGVFCFGDVLVSEEDGAMGSDIGPIGVFGEDDACSVSVGDGHDAWEVLNVFPDVKMNEVFPTIFVMDCLAGAVLEIVFQRVAERVMDHGMVPPIVKVEIGDSVDGVELGGGELGLMV